MSSNTRERILKAASEVFAQHGVKGATTREIARLAEVNETTLFRLFQNKECLLQSVVAQSTERIIEALSGTGFAGQDLPQDLAYFAEIYYRVLQENEPMVRMMIGEASRKQEEARMVALYAWKPVNEKLVAYLQEAQAQGKLRADLDWFQTVDIFKGIILSHLLRCGFAQLPYTTEDYLKTALNLFIRGISI